MRKAVFVTLCITQCIVLVSGQYVRSMPPLDSCTPSMVTLSCNVNHVPVVTRALFGVAQTPNACVYQPGDCVADAMNIATCRPDLATCNVYGANQKLPQCNNQSSSYVHVAYDCVPISMEDPAKVYDICQSGSDISSDSGLLLSPGYPVQNQTMADECSRTIRVPNDKAVRLWMTDLHIGSSDRDCARDHVLVVDSFYTYRYCGAKRFAYPLLCSSTIHIRYLTASTSSFYRGMRMFIGVVNRSDESACVGTAGTSTHGSTGGKRHFIPMPSKRYDNIHSHSDFTTSKRSMAVSGYQLNGVAILVCLVAARLVHRQ